MGLLDFCGRLLGSKIFSRKEHVQKLQNNGSNEKVGMLVLHFRPL